MDEGTGALSDESALGDPGGVAGRHGDQRRADILVRVVDVYLARRDRWRARAEQDGQGHDNCERQADHGGARALKVIYTEEAAAGIVEAITYLNERNPTAAAKLDAAITRCVERLAAKEFDGPVSRLRSGAVERSWGVRRSAFTISVIVRSS
jgi:plasmid stabilization system protein ParE